MGTVQHVALNCRDVRQQEAFYARHFGFRRARVFKAGMPDEFVLLRLGATCIELFPVRDDAKRHTGGEQAIGFKHLAFEVPDIEAAVAGLQAAGVKTDPILDCADIAPGLKVCFFNDPDGNRIELMQGYTDQFPAAGAKPV